jgi:predicted flap endonuclease-1-like 5' DNA nuclease
MKEFMQDPAFYWLVWSIFTVAGVIVGWFMRDVLSERKFRLALERTEQERNTLARLYTHLKHQHDLREADFKRATLELGNLRQQMQEYEAERNRRVPAEQLLSARLEKSEATTAQFAQKIAAMELVAGNLRQQNAELTAELNRMQEELDAWQVLYDDFLVVQQKLVRFEQISTALESERTLLRQQLDAARIEIENLQLELVQQKAFTPQKQSSSHSDRKGGPAAPENTDDLKIINGITPYAEQQLYALGIYTFTQISHWDDDSIIAFAKALGISPGKIYQEDWVGQARHLVNAER